MRETTESHGGDVKGICHEFKKIYEDMDDIDLRHRALATRVEELAAHDQQRLRSEAGMMYFARSVQAKVDELGKGFNELVTQGGLLTATVEHLA